MNDIDRMARMWNVEGLSMGQIASRYGITRQAVAGLISRNREKFKRRNTLNQRVKGSQPAEPIVTASQKANQRRKAFHAVKAAEDAAAAPVVPVEPEIDGKEYDAARLQIAKDLLALGKCDCKWPLNDGGPFVFCAEEVVAGSVYCRHHKGRAKGKGTASEQKAASDLRRAA